MIHFGVIHATYRERHTMPDTVASLHAAGVPHVTLFPDKGVYGAFRNLDRALRYLVSIAKDGEYVCVADDDLVVCKDALMIVEQSLKLNPDVPHTLYTVHHSIRHLDLAPDFVGWVSIEPSWAETWGGMVVMKKEVAAAMIEHAFWIRYRQTDKEGRHCDVATFETLRRMGHKVMAHIPSLTKDIGHGVSTIGNEHTPETQGYRFDEWEPTPSAATASTTA